MTDGFTRRPTCHATWILILGVLRGPSLLPDVSIPAAGEPSLQDLEMVRDRMIARWIAAGGTREQTEDANRYVRLLRPDGTWADVDYADRQPSRWKTISHLHRLRSMATLHGTAGQDPADRARLLEAILSALRLWIDRDFQNPNWWWNEIGVPMALGPTLLLLGDRVPPDLRTAGVKILGRARLGRGTGQNLVWLTEMALIRGCLQKRPEVVARAFARIAEEVRISTGEGIQPDFSFHQHGAQLYSGGYGYGFSVDVPRIAFTARDTAFAFPANSIQILTRYLLDGQRWMVHGGTFDHAAVGREITRRGRGRAGGLARACDDLLALDPPRADELREFARSLRHRGSEGAHVLSGHRHFWRSDFTVHRRPGYSTSVKMASRRLRGWEIVNSEGLRSHHTAEGMQLIYRGGDEYVDVFGAWDWLAIPGATILRSKDTFRSTDARGSTDFVGGATDGEYGIAAMALARSDLRARKAWFFFDEEIICLGSGIESSAAAPVWTTVNQCRQQGEVTTGESGKSGDAKGIWWAHHDGVGYAFPREYASSVRQTAGPRASNWHTINQSHPDEPVTVDVFHLWLDHGTGPRGASYAYAVVPDTDAATLASLVWPVQILANRPNLQAVLHRELQIIGAVFYSPGPLEIDSETTLAVNEPCILFLRERPGTLELIAASPEHREPSLIVSLPWRLRGEGAEAEGALQTRVTIELPGGPLAGSSVVRTLQRVR